MTLEGGGYWHCAVIIDTIACGKCTTYSCTMLENGWGSGVRSLSERFGSITRPHSQSLLWWLLVLPGHDYSIDTPYGQVVEHSMYLASLPCYVTRWWESRAGFPSCSGSFWDYQSDPLVRELTELEIYQICLAMMQKISRFV